MLSARIEKLEPSPTLSLDAKVKEMSGKGAKIINLGLGEPDFSTPNHVGNAAIEAIRTGFTHYTPAAGIPELRKAFAEKLKRENGLLYSPDEIVVGVGSKFLLYCVFQVLCDPGDEVILSTPTWSTYVEQIKLAGGVPIEIPLSRPFKLTAADILPKLGKKTKIILLNSPANPTGAMIEKEELLKIGKLAVEKNVFIVSDEIYEHITYEQNLCTSIASLDEDIKKQTITINGLSKSHAMTGWRVGFAGGPKEIIKGIVSLQGQATSGTSSITQKAATAALDGGLEEVKKMRNEFAARRTFLINEFSKISNLHFTAPEGAFYFFVDIKDCLDNDACPTSAAWCSGLLEKEKIAVVPGEAFHAPGYFRLSFAASMEDLKKGVEGIARFAAR